MPFKKIKGGVCAPKGFRAAASAVGIKGGKAVRDDLTAIYSELPCVSAGTFTTNKVKAAPVRVTQSNRRAKELRASARSLRMASAVPRTK